MNAIRTFNNTKCELDMAKKRLNLLMDRKESLYCKYFPITSKLKDVVVDGSKNNDKMVDYLYELHDVIDIGVGKSLADQIIEEQKTVANLQCYLNDMADCLSKMKGVEYQLYYEIVYNGVKITKAVENIAEKNNIEPQTIWKNYYRKIKNFIVKLQWNYSIHRDII